MAGYQDLIYPWNEVNYEGRNTQKVPQLDSPIELDDETLRDGLQSSSVRIPHIEEKLKILHYMDDLGIHIADVGIPSAGETIKADVHRIAQEVAKNKLKIKLACAGRTLISDMQPIVDIMQATGVDMEAHVFVGSSKIRYFAEDWNLDRMLKATEDTLKFCEKEKLSVMYVTEDTTRAEPRVLKKLYTTAIEAGARRVCISDTVGYATPDGIINVVDFMRKIIWDTGEKVKIDWHGHNDRGLAVSNAIVAARDAGVNRIHGTCLGIGERSGNASIDQIIINFYLLGIYSRDLSALGDYCNYVSKVCGLEIPVEYPAMGRDAFRTSTGVHAAAIIKAMEKTEDKWLADLVYSSVPAHVFGLEQKIEIGPMSGRSNVIFWLKKRNIEVTPEKVTKIMEHAKHSNHLLRDEEILRILQ
jgi:2-isopropylmalate synthase